MPIDDFCSFGVASVNLRKDFPFVFLVNQMRWHAFSIFYPVRALKALGLYPKSEIGHYPVIGSFQGEGQFYCHRYHTPCYLEETPDEYYLVEDFDRLSSFYEKLLQPFTVPIFEESVELLRPFLVPDTRILDLSCGPGTELLQLAAMVPHGEVVGVDLSAGMISTAFENARHTGAHNTAFFQADVVNLPAHFEGHFDAVYCSLAFHHYPEPLNAVKEIYRVLNEKGKAFIIDPGAGWLNLISRPFVVWGDPGWVGFYAGESLQSFFDEAGFSEFYWTEILPGIGVSIGTK